MKRTVSIILCFVLLFGLFGICAYAELPESVDYKRYTFVGDSFSWGYGLDPDVDSHDLNYLFHRMEGSFPDIVGRVLEEKCGAEVCAAASSGCRLCDYREMIEVGMGREAPYRCPDDWFGNRAPERTAAVLASGEYVCDCLRGSDLVTFEIGANDITAAAVNALDALGIIDVAKISGIDGAEGVFEYLLFALQNLEMPEAMLRELIEAFVGQIDAIRENAEALLGDVVELAPGADILLIGYNDAFTPARIIPGTDYSLVMTFIDLALASFNDMFCSFAEQYSNVHYVDTVGAHSFFDDGMLLTDCFGGDMDLLLALHPNAEGHRFIADRVLDAIAELHTCRHENTKLVMPTCRGLHGYGYTGSLVCADCGKVLDMGSIISPFGDFSIPENTVRCAVHALTGIVSQTVERAFRFAVSLFAK